MWRSENIVEEGLSFTVGILGMEYKFEATVPLMFLFITSVSSTCYFIDVQKLLNDFIGINSTGGTCSRVWNLYE